MIDRLVDAGKPVNTCCRLLGVSRQGYHRYRRRPTSATELRRRWLSGLIDEVHGDPSTNPNPGEIVHLDHRVQFTSWVFPQKIQSAGILPSFRTVGDGLDNAMMESVCSSIQIELLNRQKWPTRVWLKNGIFDYSEVFYNRRRHHSSLAYATSHDYDITHTPEQIPPRKLV